MNLSSPERAQRTRRIRHGDLDLALHELAPAAPAKVAPLLLLHELGGSSAAWHQVVASRLWPGPVFALDFAGHGASDWRAGGAYTPELFAADADRALAGIGASCCVAGAGVGAYVALLLAGARPTRVHAALLLPGAGLGGGGAQPADARIAVSAARLAEIEATRDMSHPRARCDPMVEGCNGDLRPVDYAAAFAGAARRLLLAEDGDPRPPWWEAARDLPRAELVTNLSGQAFAALARYTDL